jgi:hypothetical protein
MKFLKAIYSIIESFGQARAATALTRAGKINEAKALYGK